LEFNAPFPKIWALAYRLGVKTCFACSRSRARPRLRSPRPRV